MGTGRLLVGMDDLVEYWTLLDEELELVTGKRGATRLGFALLLKHYTRHGRVPRGRAGFADEDRRVLTPLFCQHVRLYGEVRLEMPSRLSLGTSAR